MFTIKTDKGQEHKCEDRLESLKLGLELLVKATADSLRISADPGDVLVNGRDGFYCEMAYTDQGYPDGRVGKIEIRGFC